MTEGIKEFARKHIKTLLFFAIVGAVGGLFLGFYTLDSYPDEIREAAYAEGLNDILIGIITAVQSAGYGFVLGAIGIAIAEHIGLFKNERSITPRPLIAAIAVAVATGVLIILPDLLVFNNYSEVIRDSYATKPTLVYILASVLYGGVIEEVMLRLFMLSLVALVLLKLLGKGADAPTPRMLAVANVIAALLFAAGHLPATAIMIGLTPMTVLRCFLLNGGAGLLFGRLYYRHGLRYAMIAHAGSHVVSNLIWVLLIQA